jgi:hypothetical protein
MIGNNILKPQPISVNSLRITSFDKLVAVYRTANVLDRHLQLQRQGSAQHDHRWHE